MKNHSRAVNQDLVQEHYGSDEHLNVRIRIHEQYSEPKINFPNWVLNWINWKGTETVLDVGCGSGLYLEPALSLSARYIAGDLSIGMLRKLPPGSVGRVNLDAQAIPIRQHSIDVVLANHMLYHVPDQDGALGNIWRILRPGGWLIAVTNSSTYMHQMRTIVSKAVSNLGYGHLEKLAREDFVRTFSLENGRSLLERHFDRVELIELNGELRFPKTEPVLAYINSSADFYSPELTAGDTWPRLLQEVGTLVDHQLQLHGQFRVSKPNGAFVCQK